MSRADIVLVSNWIYNFGESIAHFNSPSTPDVTAVSLLYEEGAESGRAGDREIFNYSANLYAEDVESDPSGRELVDGSINLLDEPPLWPDGLDQEDIVPSDSVREYTVLNAGPRPANRPTLEQQFIETRLEDDQEYIDSQDDVGGYPDYDTTTDSRNVPNSDIVDWIRQFTDEVELGISR